MLCENRDPACPNRLPNPAAGCPITLPWSIRSANGDGPALSTDAVSSISMSARSANLSLAYLCGLMCRLPWT